MKPIADADIESKPRERSSPGAPKDLSFKEKVRQGHYGNLRLLGICAGILLLCVLGLVLWPRGKAENAARPATDAQVVAPRIPTDYHAESAGEDSKGNSAVSAHNPPGQIQDEREVPGQLTPEERERIFREMASKIPEGQVLIW